MTTNQTITWPNTDLRNSFGEVVREHREAKKVSPETLARALNLNSRSLIDSIESGELETIDYDLALALGEKLNFDARMMINAADYVTETQEALLATAHYETPPEIRIINDLRQRVKALEASMGQVQAQLASGNKEALALKVLEQARALTFQGRDVPSSPAEELMEITKALTGIGR